MKSGLMKINRYLLERLARQKINCTSQCLSRTVMGSSLKQRDWKPNFGIMFDIDGVLLRGKSPIPSATEALKCLMDSSGREFLVPCVFCTNGFGLPEAKAATLSERLGVYISAHQMVMSQTPLAMFRDYHDKWCLVSGPEHDGGTVKVAESLGFNKIVTISDLRQAYPYLDWMDRNRWPVSQVEDNDNFPSIEAVILLGEPIRWETNLQLIIDLLITNGKPNRSPIFDGYQLPVLAVNMDLQWMAKANLPRLGHGAFLVCLESLYKKICGRDLKYTALIGKPSEITYEYAQKLIQEIASDMKIPDLRTVYAIGDNPLTDIYGANVFNQFLDRKNSNIERNKRDHGKDMPINSLLDRTKSLKVASTSESIDHEGKLLLSHQNITNERGIRRCNSILVCTGVYKPTPTIPDKSDCNHTNEEPSTSISMKETEICEYGGKTVDHGHRDLPYNKTLTRADHVVYDVKSAIDKIFEIERYCPSV